MLRRSALLAWSCGGTVAPCLVSEYGKTAMRVDTGSNLFKGLNAAPIGLMSHTDQIVKLPEGFRSVACTDNCPNAAIENKANRLYGMQFHPEVESTSRGTDMIHNFLYRVCGAEGDYDLHNLQEQLIRDIRDQVGDKHVLLALSGGVDSSVCAALLSRAIPGQLHCVFVDHGLMRKNEGDDVEAAFSGRDLPLYPCKCRRALPCCSARHHRSGAEEKDNRRRICQGVRGGDGKAPR